MKQLFITVHTGENQSTTYCFSDMPVLIGRSPKCHLSICHEAIPRELCFAWIEDDGVTVRVEERPALTNPLKMGDREILGGVSKETLSLNIGPIKIVLSAVADSTQDIASTNKKIVSVKGAMLGVLIVLVAALFSLGKDNDNDRLPGFLDLPKSPIGAIETKISAPSRSKAEVLESRAEEILAQPTVIPGAMIKAAELLTKAALALAKIDPKRSVVLSDRALIIQSKINDEYRRLVLDLGRSLETGDQSGAAESAAGILEYLGEGQDPARRRLSKLAERRPQ